MKHAPEGENEHPMAVSLLSAVPAFQDWSATYEASDGYHSEIVTYHEPHGHPRELELLFLTTQRAFEHVPWQRSAPYQNGIN